MKILLNGKQNLLKLIELYLQITQLFLFQTKHIVLGFRLVIIRKQEKENKEVI